LHCKQDPGNYNAASLQSICSAGKNFEVLALARLVDRGLLNWTDTLAQHWPRFGQFDKQAIRVSDLMRHDAGLPFFCDGAAAAAFRRQQRQLFGGFRQLPDAEVPVDYMEVCHKQCPATNDPGKGEGVGSSNNCLAGKYNVGMQDYHPQENLLPLIENSEAALYHQGIRAYHSNSRGLVVASLISKLTGRTYSTFLQEEVMAPLGITGKEGEGGVYCGISLDWQRKLPLVHSQMVPESYLNSPRNIPQIGFNINDTLISSSSPLVLQHLGANVATDEPWKGLMPAVTTMGFAPLGHNIAENNVGCDPSSSTMANANSMAKAAGAMGNGGVVEKRRLLSSETVKSTLEGSVRRYDALLMGYTAFTQAGFSDFGQALRSLGQSTEQLAKLLEGCFGWTGYGGAYWFFCPQSRLGFAYTRSGFWPGGPPTEYPPIMPLVNFTMHNVGAGGLVEQS